MGVSNHQPYDGLLNRLFRHTSKKISKLRVTGLCAGNSPVTGESPTQMASNAENVSISWRHHEWPYPRDIFIFIKVLFVVFLKYTQNTTIKYTFQWGLSKKNGFPAQMASDAEGVSVENVLRIRITLHARQRCLTTKQLIKMDSVIGETAFLVLSNCPDNKDWSSLVQILACRLFDTNPLRDLKLISCQLRTKEKLFMELESKYNIFVLKCTWKCKTNVICKILTKL